MKPKMLLTPQVPNSLVAFENLPVTIRRSTSKAKDMYDMFVEVFGWDWLEAVGPIRATSPQRTGPTSGQLHTFDRTEYIPTSSRRLQNNSGVEGGQCPRVSGRAPREVPAKHIQDVDQAFRRRPQRDEEIIRKVDKPPRRGNGYCARRQLG